MNKDFSGLSRVLVGPGSVFVNQKRDISVVFESDAIPPSNPLAVVSHGSSVDVSGVVHLGTTQAPLSPCVSC